MNQPDLGHWTSKQEVFEVQIPINQDGIRYRIPIIPA
jgi:hypothetical protein